MLKSQSKNSTASFAARYGPWAVVAGASEGLGRAWSTALARRGLNLVLLARRDEPLQTAAKEIANESGVEVRTLCVDLANPASALELQETTRHLDVGLLIYNAAVAPIGLYNHTALQDKLAAIDVNCRGVVSLTSHFAPILAKRGRGGIVLMSSMAGWQGAARIATYSASKAFVTTLGEGLWYEMREHGVDVHVCVAGAIATPNFLATTPADKQSGAFPMQPAAVVEHAIAKLGRKPTSIAGRINRIGYALLSRALPRIWAIRFFGRTSENMYGAVPSKGRTGS